MFESVCSHAKLTRGSSPMKKPWPRPRVSLGCGKCTSTAGRGRQVHGWALSSSPILCCTNAPKLTCAQSLRLEKTTFTIQMQTQVAHRNSVWPSLLKTPLSRLLGTFGSFSVEECMWALRRFIYEMHTHMKNTLNVSKRSNLSHTNSNITCMPRFFSVNEAADHSARPRNARDFEYGGIQLNSRPLFNDRIFCATYPIFN